MTTNHTISTRLDALSEQSRKIEDLAAAAEQRNRAALEAAKAALRAGASSAEAKIDDAQAAARTRWTTVRDSIDRHFADRRSAASERRSERDLQKAQHRADIAEQDAADAIDLALYVLEQAEWAVVDAALARADAADLAGTDSA